ncbi:hypothetical protein AB6A40_011135 [Gnathostoma spinigerum]|uniref:Tyrosine-protein phosphatase domain-containing protein n=1 Tax=Gnathostoma spinigerum TaxID=75299 RepID=A0ABD6EX01_9BILA
MHKLPHYESFEARASDKPDNSKKNRYGDIKAYDTTRVKLSQFCDDPSSDYINANFIKGYKGKRTFIATQGPVNASINDFWRMIWEHQVHIIVMLANLTERNRPQCAKYWPDEEDGAKMFDKIEVRPVERTLFNDYAIRTFELQRPKRAVANGSPSGHPAIVAYGNVDENGFVADATSVTVTSSREPTCIVPEEVKQFQQPSARRTRISLRTDGVTVWVLLL